LVSGKEYPLKMLILNQQTDCILKSPNQKMCVGGLFRDLAKAFDCVNHEILLTKLYYLIIKGSTANWFKSYLTDRKQKIEITSPLYNPKNLLKLGNNRA
jgi:hypothetical protein